MATENYQFTEHSNSQNTADDHLVRPKVALHTLLQHAGADKEVYTMKEVLFYLGQYIMQKQLYDQRQQHIVHCADDALGAVLGVDSFSVKEPRVLFAMITRNLTAVKTTDSQTSYTEPRSQSGQDMRPEGTDSDSSSSSNSETSSRRRRRRNTDPAGSSKEQDSEDDCEPRKRHKSDSFSLTFDQSLSWCVIGGLNRDRRSSESSDAHSNTEASSLASDLVVEEAQDSDSDNFSVEFEVESIDSDAYSQDEDVSDEDQVFEVTIFEAEEDDSFDEDTEITAADYWKCSKCEELNPPLPRNCNRCWTLRPDWFPDSVASNPAPISATPDLASPPPKTCTPDPEEGEGLDVPDGKRAKTPLISDSQDSQVSAPNSRSPAPETQSCALDSQSSAPSSGTDSQELGGSQPSTSSSAPASAPCSQDEAELERFNSLEACLPASCLEPCLICQSRPKNGCIVHGRTGHLMACYPCARKLKKRNKLCPVCREPIQSVVLTYIS